MLFGGRAALHHTLSCTKPSFPYPRRLLARRWALTPPFHPCPKAVCFLRHFSYARVFPERSDFSIGALLCGVRTFLSPKSRQANVRRLRKAFKELMWLGDMVAFTKTPDAGSRGRSFPIGHISRKLRRFLQQNSRVYAQKKFRVSTKKLDRNAIFTMIRNYYGRQKRKK